MCKRRIASIIVRPCAFDSSVRVTARARADDRSRAHYTPINNYTSRPQGEIFLGVLLRKARIFRFFKKYSAYNLTKTVIIRVKTVPPVNLLPNATLKLLPIKMNRLQ